MPGVLTALGGLVTALGTAAAVYFGGVKGDGNESRNDTTPVTTPTPVVILTQPGAPAPPTGGLSLPGVGSRPSQVLAGSGSGTSDVDTIIADWEGGLDAVTAEIADGCASGFAGDCEDLLSILLDDCERGRPSSCDVLYLVSPSGSALEDYGNTCGGRLPSSNDEWCVDIARGVG
jgi:hypothetical protein